VNLLAHTRKTVADEDFILKLKGQRIK